MSVEQVLERRLSLASRVLKWTPDRIAGFRSGFSDACVARVDQKRRHRHDGDKHGFLESALSRDLIDALGYRDGVLAAESRAYHAEDYRNDQEVLRQIAHSWSANGNNDFDLETAQWSDSGAEDLSVFLRVMDRSQWIAWFVAEHKAAIKDGREGYGDLLMQDTHEHVVYVDYGDDRGIDVWDGWHRIGAGMLKGAGHIPAIRGIPAPSLVLAP